MTNNQLGFISGFLIIAGIASTSVAPFAGTFALLVGCLGAWHAVAAR